MRIHVSFQQADCRKHIHFHIGSSWLQATYLTGLTVFYHLFFTLLVDLKHFTLEDFYLVTMVFQKMKFTKTEWTTKWQVVHFLLFSCLCKALTGQLHYSIAEEEKKGYLVGNIAKDLALNIQDLAKRKFRISSVTAEHFFNVNLENGNLYVSDRIDREAVCDVTPICSLSLEAVVESPLNIFNIEIEIKDINDNSPSFLKNIMNFEITELTPPGTRFVMINALDPDIGINSLQTYKINENGYFKLNVKTSSDGRKIPELVLEKPLDREKQSYLEIILTALDGGSPVKTGSAVIKINISDFNDNNPLFSKELYQVNLIESAPVNTLVVHLDATDEDEGINGHITYSLSHITKAAQEKFTIDSKTGEIRTKDDLDFETTKTYEMIVEAQDGGGLFSNAKVVIQIVDANDNAPEIIITSVSNSIPEDSPPGTVIALIKVRDIDSGENGKVYCEIMQPLPFEITSSSSNYFRLLTTSSLDREEIHGYNITIRATDKGYPPLSTTKTFPLLISDVNDNSPAFDQNSYVVYIPENNPSGSSIFQVQASDPDLDGNAKITYSIVNTNTDGIPVYSCVSINSMNGVLFAQCSFDYEQLKEIDIQVEAKDNGSPHLSSSTTVKIYITDLNDNAPKILYPSTGVDNSAMFEIVPLSSNKEDLVTKVIAVDADSGHNAWLSYEFLQGSEPQAFTINQHTGEIRTLRIFAETEIQKHNVIVLVKDNGTPPQSTTIHFSIIVTENFQQDIPQINNQFQKSESLLNLDMYLVVALAVISFLFTLTVMLAVISKYRKSDHPKAFGSVTTGLYSQGAPRFPTNYNNATLTLPHSYDVCVTLDSKEKEFAFVKPVQSVPIENLIDTDDSGIGNYSIIDSSPSEMNQEQAPPNADWHISQAQRPGPSGAQPAKESGVWPNNQFETERLQAMILASANEAAEGSSALGGGTGTMGLSARYGPQFTLQHLPDYRQNIYIPGTTSTLTNAAGKGKSAAPSGGNKKKSGKKDKK
ncbi:protocadherin gamma-B2 isoform X3 [Xenopus laevis]|uniref:Protocadherin gamma-B2 isoform X3 n=1 Tax=Xenopus laevis TaxID=8355 RepID=A0A8J0UTA4_XENLA|nr:protocadherin gamma-B2 isoform X3 [Xenopus laevis]